MAQYRPQTTGNRVTDEALRIVFDNLYSLQAKASGTTTSPDKCSDLEVAVRRAAALAITQAQTSSAGVAALIAVHTAIAGAHHAPFVGADATALIAAHAAIAGAHHAAFVAADAAALIAVHTAISAAHHARYTDGEADARIALHAAIAAAHHARYTDGEAVTAMGVLANINPLNHDRYTDAEAIAAVAIGDVVRGSAALTTDNKLVEVSAVDGSLQEISDQAANAVLAGPAAGVPAAPGFRALASTELSDTAGLVRGAAALDTVGYVPVVTPTGSLTIDKTVGGQFFWDTATHRLGIGTAAPNAPLHVVGDIHIISPGVLKFPAGGVDPRLELYGGALAFAVDAGTATARFRMAPAGTDLYLQNTDVGSFYFSGLWGAPIGGDFCIVLAGNMGVGTTAPKSKLHVVGLPVYANNAAAVAGGLTAGAFYRTNADPDPVCVVH